MLFLVTRPEPDGSKLKAMIEAGGAIAEPLMEAVPADAISGLDGVSAIVDRRNGLRALACPHLKALTLPVRRRTRYGGRGAPARFERSRWADR